MISDVRDDAGNVISAVIRVGKGGDFNNLDALVMSAVDEVIDEEYRDDTELVVICGRKLLSDKYFPLVNKEQENSEKLAADLIISQKRIGGLQAVRAPYFPKTPCLSPVWITCRFTGRTKPAAATSSTTRNVTGSRTTNPSMKPMLLRIIAEPR